MWSSAACRMSAGTKPCPVRSRTKYRYVILSAAKNLKSSRNEGVQILRCAQNDIMGAFRSLRRRVHTRQRVHTAREILELQSATSKKGNRSTETELLLPFAYCLLPYIRLPESHSSQLLTVRGKGSTSRMLPMPVRYMTQRSKPRPKPACRVEPYLRRSR